MLRSRVSTEACGAAAPAGRGTPAPRSRSGRATAGIAGAEDGSATLEFVLLALALLVPIVYLVIALGAVQAQALGVETAARHLARTIATAPDAGTARERAERALDGLVAEYGIDRDTVRVSTACGIGATACPEAGAMLTVTVRAAVALPLVPGALARVPVEASSAHKVSRYPVGSP